MDVTIEDLPPLNIAAVKAKSTSARDLGAAWQELIGWLGSDRVKAEKEISGGLGVIDGRPGSKQAKYEAAWPVDSRAKGSRTVKVRALPAGTYAVARQQGAGSWETWQAAINAILDEWIPDSGCKPAKGPFLIIRRGSPIEVAPDEMSTEICVPVIADRKKR